MSKKIAVITGASSGIGKRFCETISEYGVFDEIWVIARRLDKLNQINAPYPVKAVSMDLSNKESLSEYNELLIKEKPNIALLINASGYGKFAATEDLSLEENINMIDLNCEALVSMCYLSLRFMKEGAKIINIASVAAFQPVPYINVYSASKAFVLNFSRSLNRELKHKRIGVMAVCPFWTKTEFFNRAIDNEKEAIVKKYTAMYYPEQIVKRAWRDAKRGRDVSKFGFIARFQAFLSKILPHSFVMSYWINQQKIKKI